MAKKRDMVREELKLFFSNGFVLTNSLVPVYGNDDVPHHLTDNGLFSQEKTPILVESLYTNNKSSTNFHSEYASISHSLL